MDRLKLREANSSDYDTVVSLMQQLNPDDSMIDRAQGMEIFNTILKTEGLTIFVADVGGQSVSTCYLNVIPNLTRSGQAYAVIENVVTDEAHRRNGFGAAMLKQVIDKAFDIGCYKVMLLTGRNIQAHSFYEHCGMVKNSKTAFVIRK